MTATVTYISAAILAYLLGAIPFGLIIAGARHIDIRKVGSGNIGATNVFRSVGRIYGIITFILDAAKGFTASFFVPALALRMITSDIAATPLAILCAASAVAGHNWPVYISFKGGKGVATSAGAFSGIAPLAVAAGFITWILTLITTRYVSVSSIMAALAVAAFGWMLYIEEGYTKPVVLSLLGLIIVFRHKSNIIRLVRGTEPRIREKKERSAL